MEEPPTMSQQTQSNMDSKTIVSQKMFFSFDCFVVAVLSLLFCGDRVVDWSE